MRPSTGLIVQLAQTADDLPVWDNGAPLRIPIHWASLDRGLRLVHGATLGNSRDAVLIAGPGGSGKSSTTLGGIANGLQTVGDDYVLVTPTDPPIAMPVYRLLKQDQSGVDRIDGLSERLGTLQPNWQGKVEFNADEFFPGCIANSQRIRAILVPAICHAQKTRIEPIDWMASLRALARPTLEQIPCDRDTGLLFCMGLSKKVPGFRLLLPNNATEIAEKIEKFIEGLAW
jgi:hypothetical protein